MSDLEVVMMKRIGELNAEVKYLQDKVERLTAEVSYDKRVQLHVDKLAAEFTQSEVERLQAEVERLRIERNGFEQAMKANQSILETKRDVIERLRKAGDAVALDYAERIEIEAGDTAKNLMRKLPVLREWNAAKESSPNE